MNYFGHTVLAVRRSSEPAFVLGSMLPDFATMIRARPPGVAHGDIESGMRFHRRTDEVFHQSAAFLRLTRQALTWLSARGIQRGSGLAVAHIGVEVLLDAALAGDDRAQAAYRAALEGAAAAELGRHIGWTSDAERARFASLRERLLARGPIAGDITPETVAERLRYALAGRPRLSLDDAAVRTVGDWARIARPDVDACAAPLVRELAERLR